MQQKEVEEFDSNVRALFRYEMFLDFATVALSFVCGKHCSIIN